MASTAKRTLWFCIRLAVTLIVLIIVVLHVEMRSVVTTLRHAALSYLPWVVVLVLVNRWLIALRWNVFLKRAGVDVGILSLLRITILSEFYGLLLPTRLGSDAISLLYMKQQKHDLTASAVAIVANRLLGILMLSAISALAVVIGWESPLEKRLSLLILGICAIVWVFTFGLLWRACFTLVRGVAQRTLRGVTKPQSSIRAVGNMALDKADEMHLVLRAMFSCSSALVKVGVLTVVMLLVRVMAIDLLFRSLGVVVPFEYELAFVPMIMLLVMVPISISGIGVAEGAFVYLFSAVGVDPVVALGVPLLSYVVQLLVLSGGRIFFMFVASPLQETEAANVCAPSKAVRAGNSE